ncbi:MAG TPA: HAMP domain-containing sensor histidine kinase [Tissierellaceae bacterium]|nr:HAMP domain-containing sensor histidine kinase [Tissierellaceae bacterium]
MESYNQDFIEDIKYDKEMEESLNILINLSEEIFHDFKNNLATISGLSQLTVLEENLSMGAKDNLNTINKSTLESKKVLDRFYNLIKGFDVEKNDNLSLANLVIKTLEMVKHRINKSKNGNKIELNLNLNSSRKIYCNEYKMRQAILNLVLNALDAMEDNCGILEINLYEREGAVILEISDTGVGIPKKDQNHIFNSNFTTKGKNGTGYGLSISKETFEEYGGKVSVESRIGYGSKFTVVFDKS